MNAPVQELWYSLTVSPHVLDLVDEDVRDSIIGRFIEMGVVGITREATKRGLIIDLTTLQGDFVPTKPLPKIMLTATAKEPE